MQWVLMCCSLYNTHHHPLSTYLFVLCPLCWAKSVCLVVTTRPCCAMLCCAHLLLLLLLPQVC
jgi:hypothetical protein